MSSVRRREIDHFYSTACPLDSKLQSNPIHFHPRKLSAHSPVCCASWEVRCPQQCSLRRCNLELFAYRQHPASVSQWMVCSFEDQEVHGLNESEEAKTMYPAPRKSWASSWTFQVYSLYIASWPINLNLSQPWQCSSKRSARRLNVSDDDSGGLDANTRLHYSFKKPEPWLKSQALPAFQKPAAFLCSTTCFQGVFTLHFATHLGTGN